MAKAALLFFCFKAPITYNSKKYISGVSSMQIADLLNSEEIMIIEEIEKGWSMDKKYYIQLYNGTKMLLRKSALDTYTRKTTEFDAMKQLHQEGLPISEPLDIKGVEDEIQSLFRWVEGTDASDRITQLTEEEQYRLGLESGKILKRIHELDVVPENIEAWGSTFQRKIERNITRYQSCGLTYDNDAFFLDAIKKYQHLIQNRPQTFQHGDYHIGNMLLTEDNQLRLIDFNRWDYGDPWEEFNRIDFTVEMSAAFATGQLNSYFSGQPPLEFFELLLLYIASNTLSALPWALNYSEKEVQTMRNKAARVQGWYTASNSVIPNWYDETLLSKYGL